MAQSLPDCEQRKFLVPRLQWQVPVGSRSIFIWRFLKDDILACVETWD